MVAELIGWSSRLQMLDEFLAELREYTSLWNPTAAECVRDWLETYPARTHLHLEPSVWQDYPGSRNPRAKATQSAWPSATIASAWCGMTIMPTASTVIPLAFLTAAASGTWYPAQWQAVRPG